MTHVLDTSAILAHYFDEPGAEEVAALIAATARSVDAVLPEA